MCIRDSFECLSANLLLHMNRLFMKHHKSPAANFSGNAKKSFIKKVLDKILKKFHTFRRPFEFILVNCLFCCIKTLIKAHKPKTYVTL